MTNEKDSVTDLNLTEEILTDLKVAEICRLTNLRKLIIGWTRLRWLPAEIGKLTNLTYLDLSGNKLTELPAEIGKLTNLTYLDLRYNKLTELPAEIGKLTNLTYLDLSCMMRIDYSMMIDTDFLLLLSKLTKLPAEIGKLTNLTELYLSDNDLTVLPAEIGGLTNLKELYLSDNQLTGLPAEIGGLTNLKELYLCDNQLTGLPAEIGKLTNLTELYLGHNQLTELPAEIGRLTNLTVLYLDGNPLTSPPPEIVEQGTPAILAYLREQLRAKQPQWVSKLLVVGEGGVGKTSLLRSLRGERFNSQESTTHGIEVRALKLSHPTKVGVTMQLNAWDFGGQEIYHATHQFFLTNRSLFLLAWNARHGFEQGKLYYWLDTIQALAPDSPILLVATHIDERDASIPLAELRRKYPQIAGHCEISSKTGKGIDTLRQSITDTAAKLPLMGEIWPATWLNAANAIRSMPEKYVTPQKLADVMVAHGVSPDSVPILAQWLHELGDILYFKDSEALNDIVILKPQWVTEYISKVLESQEVINRSGVFTRAHQAQLWQDLEPYMRDHFLRLMEQFDLAYRIPDSLGSSPTDASLIVERLPLDPPNYQQKWDAIKASGNCNEISMKWRLNTIPAGIPTWFIARSHRFSTGTHWRNGALFADRQQKHLALVQVFPHERYLELTVRGATPQNFFDLLLDGIEVTLARFPGLQVKRKTPCPGSQGQPCSNEFDSEQLQKRYEKKKLTIECPNCLEEISVIKLLFGLDLTAQIRVTPNSPQNTANLDAVLSLLEEINANLAQGQDKMLAAQNELLELSQREFTKIFRVEQAKIESHCPNIFVLRPRDRKNWLTALAGQKLDLQLYCQAPGYLHPTQQGGLYEIDDPAEWLKAIAPYVRNLVKLLKFATPLFGPWVRLLNQSEYEALFKSDMELMKLLAEQLPAIEASEEGKLGGGMPNNYAPEELQGAALRALRQLLDEKDPQQHWGGLKKILTPEGHYLWLCDHHAKQYKV